MQLQVEVQESHRHDVHQVLAYAATTAADAMTAVLVYPVRREAWERLAEQQATVAMARLPQPGRNLTLALAAVPLQHPQQGGHAMIAAHWGPLMQSTLESPTVN